MNIHPLIPTQRVFLLTAAILVAAASSPSQATRPDITGAPGSDMLAALHWRELGPAVVGGRIDDFAVVENNPDIVYVATASGGVWKSVDGTLTWRPIFEHNGAMSIGAIAVAPSDASVVWVGTGEANNRQSSSWGNGVYKSTDGGETWNCMGLEDTQHIGRIIIDPRNPNVVYVAALGHLWGPNDHRGLYKTIDGGKTWTRVLFIDQDTGVVDVKLDPESPDTLYAASYQRRRTPFGFNGGGPHSAIYKSTTGGATWKKLVNGLPYADGGDTGRIGVAVYRKDPRIVYAEIQHAHGGLYRSEDWGETWTKMSGADPNPPYFSNIYIDPNNDLRIWVAALQGSGEMAGVAYSQDGGKTFVPDWGLKVHPDFHAMWIDPANSRHMIIGVDGGMYTSRDGGVHWEHLNQIPIGQAYQVGYDMAQPYHVCAGFQDNGSARGPAATRDINGIRNSDWLDVLAGDGFHCQPDQHDSNLVYVESQDGSLLRLNVATHEWANIVPQPQAGEAPYRFEWNAPIIASSHDPKTIYFGAQFLFKSTDRGDAWKVISPDLTTSVDRNKLPIMGELPKDHILSRNYGVTWYPCITRISESPVNADVLWVGTDDGNLQMTQDGGKTWHNVAAAVPGVPKGTYVSGIEASHKNAGTAYVVFDGHRTDDFSTYIFLTTDFGQTWHSVSGDLPHNTGTAHVIREDPRNANLLFAGTEFGAYISFDAGGHWSLLGNNLPAVRVDDIQIQPREHDLILATHGRSLWILDDITPLEQADAPESQNLYLFNIRPAISFRQIETSSGVEGLKPFVAPNPPYGALIDYRLSHATKDDVVITITDKSGKVVRELRGSGKDGLNRVNWDLRYSTPIEPTSEQRWAMAEGFFYRVVSGPFVNPGEYAVNVKVGDEHATRNVHVQDDPAVSMSPQDRATRSAAILHAYELYKSSVQSAATFRALKTSVDAALKPSQQENSSALSQDSRKQIEDFANKLNAISRVWIPASDPMNAPLTYVPPPVPERVAHVLFIMESYSAAPRQRDLQQLSDLEHIYDDASKQLTQLVNVDLSNLNKSLREAAVPYIAVPNTNPVNPKKPRHPFQ